MAKPRFYEKYEEILRFSGIRIPAPVMVLLTLILVVASVFVGLLIDVTLAILLPLVALDVGFGLPFYLADKKIAQIEQRLPDVLHHMGTTLKTGGTIEVALREVSRIEYGPITKGVREMLREINEGKTFEDAFSDFALRSRSPLLQRVAVIIIAARRSGGALVETLSAMAEDIRAIYRLKRERKTKTFMQFLFIIVAGVLIAPFVFGIVKSVLEILIKVGGEATRETLSLIAQFDMLFKSYIIIESALAILGAVQVREGGFSKAVIYIPIGAIISYLIYITVSASFLPIIGGA